MWPYKPQMVTGQTEKEEFGETGGKCEWEMEEGKQWRISQKAKEGWGIFAIIVNGWSRQTSALAIGGLRCWLTIKYTQNLPCGEKRRR